LKTNKLIFVSIFTIFLIGNIFAASLTSGFGKSAQASNNFSANLCQEGQDFIIQLTPFGCTPSIVRTDLLEENEVPVYCKLGATKINPLINVESIDSVSFSGQYSPEVSGVSFYPARAALNVEGKLNSPILDNIGYVLIKLKKQPNSSAMPEYVTGNLTAKVKYNIQNAFGIGSALFYLDQTNDAQWVVQKYKSGFWNGKGYIRVTDIEKDNADISVYSNNEKISDINFKKGANYNLSSWF
jgi:hypothetical protein